ncbi:MAG: ESX secretion-associated protein EspG [Labedaea sp.]
MTRNIPVEHRAERGGPAVHFGLIELDLLATYAGASIPYPLRVPSFGGIPGERDVLFTVAAATMRHRALADEDGPIGIGDDLAAGLAARNGTVHLVLSAAGEPVGIAAIIDHDQALLCRQTLSDVATELVEVRPVELDGLADALVDLTPPLHGAKTIPVRIPTAAARLLLRSLGDNGGPSNRLYQIADRYRCSVDDLDLLLQAAKTVTGGGRLGAALAAEHGKDVPTGSELSWMDSPVGRLRVTVEPDEDHGWLSVNPLHPNDLRAVAMELVALVRRRRRP